MSKDSSNNQEQNKSKESSSAYEEVNRSGGMQDASASKGGTTDLTNQTSGRGATSDREVGPTTKKNVTGSDFDGQVSNQ
jgi:hypothetical protein